MFPKKKSLLESPPISDIYLVNMGKSFDFQLKASQRGSLYGGKRRRWSNTVREEESKSESWDEIYILFGELLLVSSLEILLLFHSDLRFHA